MALDLEVREKAENELGVQVFELEFGRLFMQLSMGEIEEQPEAITVGGHGAGAGAQLLNQALRKELLEQSWKTRCG